MVRNPPVERNLIPPRPGWSNRILLLSLAGICFLTLYPFRFTLQASLPKGASPFLLAGIGKVTSPLDTFLNVLLFIPLGFGLSEKLREIGWTLKEAFFATWTAGTLLSYIVEFLQLYIPVRDSGWEDIITNGAGAAIGAILFAFLGTFLVGFAVNLDRSIRGFLAPQRLIVVLSIYFGLWFALSAVLQRDTRLDNWNLQSQLVVGGVTSPKLSSPWIQTWYSAPWKGTVSRLQIWNRPVRDAAARALTAGESTAGPQAGMLADYDFTSANPLEDRLGFLPPFVWTQHPPISASPQGLAIDSGTWLASSVTVSNLVEAFQKTNQFSLRVVCTPAETFPVDERIVSIKQPSGAVDLHLGQDNDHLILWFRNRLSIRHAILAWIIPKIFVAGQPRDILFSYDGSNLSLYVNGKKNPHAYVLGPGTRLAEFFRRVRPAELSGYNFVYEALIFFPAGALIGMATTRKSPRSVATNVLFACGFLVPPALYEGILSHVSGRTVSFESLFFSLILAIAGSLWINADRIPAAHAVQFNDGTVSGGQPETGNTG